MKKFLFVLMGLFALLLVARYSHAAMGTRFDVINFEPVVDSSDYFTVYGSQVHAPWQGTFGLVLDYNNRALEFRATGGATGRQSVVDNMLIANAFGSISFTDWFQMGINIPVSAYTWFYTPDVNATSDNGFSMGDIMLVSKFRILDINEKKVGLAIMPFATLPSGDTVRFGGNGSFTGGAKLVVDARLHDRVEASINAGYTMRDDYTEDFIFSGGGTSTVRIDDMFTFGGGVNVKMTRNFHAIAEINGNTVTRDFFKNTNTTSLEAGGGIRYYFADSGFSMDAGGGAGIIEGIGTPRYRGFLGLRWTSPVPQPCPECKAPEPRIKDNKIVLWGKIFFDTDKASIKPISFPVLDDVVEVLKDHPEITLVEVQGHTDWRGSDSYNMKLSQRRAESAMKYLVDHGISASRLKAVGYGESQPIASNDTVEGMSQNRRTEFVIISSTTGEYGTTPGVSQDIDYNAPQQFSTVPAVPEVVDTVSLLNN